MCHDDAYVPGDFADKAKTTHHGENDYVNSSDKKYRNFS